jgi:hypothetical protein
MIPSETAAPVYAKSIVLGMKAIEMSRYVVEITIAKW